MAGNDGHVEPGLLIGIGAIIAPFIGALGLWLANRLIGKAAVETALDGRMKTLLNGQQSMIDRLNSIVHDLEGRVTAAEAKAVTAEARAEKATHDLAEANADRQNLRGDVRQMRQLLDSAGLSTRAASPAVVAGDLPIFPPTTLSNHGLPVDPQTDDAV